MMKKITSLILAGALALGLASCSTGNGSDPRSVIDEISFAFTVAEGAYGAICSSNPDASFCDHEDYIKAQAALSAALQTAQDAIAVSGNVNSATILNLIHTLEMDWNTYNSIIKSVKAKKAAYDKARLTP